MRLFAVSVCHMQPEIIAFSLTRAIMTMGVHPFNWTLVDHHWPISKMMTSALIRDSLVDIVLGFVIQPEKNLGAHGGFNFAIQRLIDNHNLSDDDLVLSYDPDSNPVTPDWLKAMSEVMTADPLLDYLSLMPEVCKNNRVWHIRNVAGYAVATHEKPEMINVTLWRGRCIKQKLTAYSALYGHVESAMWDRGFKSAYLLHFLEDPCPIYHPQIYADWKIAHSSGKYPGNFDQYIKDKNGNS